MSEISAAGMRAANALAGLRWNTNDEIREAAVVIDRDCHIRKVIGFGEALAEWLETPDKDRGQSAAYMAAELRHVIALLTE